MDKSWFARTSFNRLPQDSTHELPRWRSSSPMAASMIPPPILPPKSHSRSPVLQAKSIVLQQSSTPDDREQELQANLQYLLDAQAEGLLRGLEGGTTSTGSTTPTLHPTPRKPTLRAARKGLYTTMLALSALKSQTLTTLTTTLQHTDTTMHRIEKWQDKRTRLLAATSSPPSSPSELAHLSHMTAQADSLAQKIGELERQLGDLRGQHKSLMARISAVENESQARKATYTASLRLLDEEVQRFVGGRGKTLEGVKGEVGEEVWELLGRVKVVEKEKGALEEGGEVWRGVVEEVMGFERELRGTMGRGAGEEEMRGLLERLDGVISRLEGKMEICEREEWRLLIAAVGAELHALKEGRKIIEGVLGIERGEEEKLVDTGTGEDKDDEIAELEKQFGEERIDDHAEEDDDPDPELMFSRQGIDE